MRVVLPTFDLDAPTASGWRASAAQLSAGSSPPARTLNADPLCARASRAMRRISIDPELAHLGRKEGVRGQAIGSGVAPASVEKHNCPAAHLFLVRCGRV
jgi:hypothetical protein